MASFLLCLSQARLSQSGKTNILHGLKPTQKPSFLAPLSQRGFFVVVVLSPSSLHQLFLGPVLSPCCPPNPLTLVTTLKRTGKKSLSFWSGGEKWLKTSILEVERFFLSLLIFFPVFGRWLMETTWWFSPWSHLCVCVCERVCELCTSLKPACLQGSQPLSIPSSTVQPPPVLRRAWHTQLQSAGKRGEKNHTKNKRRNRKKTDFNKAAKEKLLGWRRRICFRCDFKDQTLIWRYFLFFPFSSLNSFSKVWWFFCFFFLFSLLESLWGKWIKCSGPHRNFSHGTSRNWEFGFLDPLLSSSI